VATARRLARAGTAGGLLLTAALLLDGCARIGPPPEGPTGRGGAAPAAAEPAAPAGAAGEATPTGPAATAAPAVPGDPSEVMSPEELASIPDPVPGAAAPAGTAAADAGASRPAGAASGGAAETTGAGGGTEPQTGADSSLDAPGGGSGGQSPPGVWRVQVFASNERAQADRVAREASEQLGAAYVIQREGALYKVRLGAFAREVDAQSLRERALRAGFPGAFRVRTSADGNGSVE
jgi:hypothetical protein